MCDTSHSSHHHHHHPGDATGLCAHTTTPLSEGCGEGKVLFFDAFSGVSGDMIIAALCDLGAPLHAVEAAVQTLRVGQVPLSLSRPSRHGIAAAHFEVGEAPNVEVRTWAAIDDMLAHAPLAPDVQNMARAIFRLLASAESRAHGIALESVHFHEVGAIDSVVDIVGAAALLSWLNPTEIVCSPIPIPRGFIRAGHGVLPLPAPATLECLRDVPTYGVDLAEELVTPTGAAILKTTAVRFERWPAMIPNASGFGAGSADFPEWPNLLRVVLGTPIENAGSVRGGATVQGFAESRIHPRSTYLP